MNAPAAAGSVAPPAVPDKADVQALVAYGYRLDCSRHFVLEVRDAKRARDFIAGLVDGDYLACAAHDGPALRERMDKGRIPVNIGFTYPGLEKLGLPVPYLFAFREKAEAFTEGALPRAARHLADTGPSAAEWWEPSFRNHRSAHVLLSLHADRREDLEQMTRELRAIAADDGGLANWDAPLDAEHLDVNPDWRTAHFDLRDGIANPRICGLHRAATHAPGELLLGYPNDNDFNPWLLVNPWPLANPWLLPAAALDPRFFRNGSFAALRKMAQDVPRFKDFVACWAGRLGESEDYVKAKLTGRWENGNVMQPGETRAPAKPADDLDGFDFSDDPDGEGCPFGAHIRRMNPRADLVVPFRRRPLMRRGMPYGPRYEAGERPDVERGLLGLFFCASLEDQFEHLLSEWGNANPMGPYNRGSAKDPLMGNHENSQAVYDVPMPEDRFRQLYGFTPFVTTRGTLYAFFPGRTALAMIPKLAGGKA